MPAKQRASSLIKSNRRVLSTGNYVLRSGGLLPGRPKNGATMFRDHINGAVAQATFPQLSRIQHEVWAAWSAGSLTDAEAQELADRIQSRKRALPIPRAGAINSPAGFLRPHMRLRQRSVDRVRSIDRRRRLAASGPLPPALACHFTTGEIAALRIVADEVRQHGSCSDYIDAIADRSGTSRSVVKRAIATAIELRIILRIERRRRGYVSDTNIIRIISREWMAWINRGPKKNHHRYSEAFKIEKAVQKIAEPESQAEIEVRSG